MPIAVKCGECGKSYKAPDKAAGKSFACQACGTSVRVPGGRPKPRKKPPADDNFLGALDDAVDHEDYGEAPGTNSLPPAQPVRKKSSSGKKQGRRKRKSIAWKMPAMIGASLILAGVLVTAGIKFLPAMLQEVQALGDGSAEAAAAAVAIGEVPPGEIDGPHFPYAVLEPPSWLADDCPQFDVREFFQAPPPEENAAPLYLQAFAEYHEDMQNCFASADPGVNWQTVADRRKRLDAVFKRWKDRPTSVDLVQLESLVKEYEPAFEKLKLAQERPECVFQTGVGISALLPHGMAARTSAKVRAIETFVDMQKSDPAAAIDRVRRELRLSRDLARRNGLIMQLVAGATETICLTDAVPWILRKVDLPPEDCKEVLQVLLEHEQQQIDCFREMVCFDYVMHRWVLHGIEHRIGEFSKSGIRQRCGLPDGRPATPGYALAFLLYETQGLGDGVSFAENFDRIVDQLGSGYLANERLVLDEFTDSVFGCLDQPYAQKFETLKQLDERSRSRRTEKTPLFGLLFIPNHIAVEAFTRNKTCLRAMQCLTTLRHWEIVRITGQPDLLTAVREAGMDKVPLDPYDDQPLRMIMLDGQTVVYSVGSDLKDDKAQSDWKFGESPGDFIFRL